MAHIPTEHKQFEILPNSLKGDWEVVSYDEKLLGKLINSGVVITYPYQIRSLELYYNEIDECIKTHHSCKNILLEFKNDLIVRNNKLNWGILRYHGKSNTHFTKNRYYYVPMFKKDGRIIVDGIIDDEEFTSYVGWELNYDFKDFEVIVDPYGILA